MPGAIHDRLVQFIEARGSTYGRGGIRRAGLLRRARPHGRPPVRQIASVPKH